MKTTANRKKPGRRPRSADGAAAYSVSVKLTEAERVRAVEVATRLGVSLAELARRGMLSQEPSSAVG